ncbi:MAG TPA: Rieske (2Fe-2S) protein [Gemmatimonadaceae bacterium]|nr:Rieske (2Fe-2S) protein [Gemmatimonadaceae bacterium]
MTDEDTGLNCGSCPISEAVARRDFLRDAIGRALLAVGALSLLPSDGTALTMSIARGIGARTDKAYPLPATDGVAIDKDESVIIARVENRAYAFSLACPHQNTAIRWEASDHRFQCPKHKSRYRPDGVFIEGRATRGLDRFAVRLQGDQLLVNLDALYREDENAAQWAVAFVDLSAHT